MTTISVRKKVHWSGFPCMNSKYHIFSLIIPILLKEQRQWKKLKIDQPRGPSTRSNHLEDETHQESLYRKAWSYLHGKHLGRCLKIEFTVQKFIALLACFSVKTLAADGRGSLFFALPFLLLLVCWSADQVVFLVVQGSGKLASGSNDGDQDFWNRITTWRVNALPSLLLLLLLFVFSKMDGRPKLLPSVHYSKIRLTGFTRRREANWNANKTWRIWFSMNVVIPKKDKPRISSPNFIRSSSGEVSGL